MSKLKNTAVLVCLVSLACACGSPQTPAIQEIKTENAAETIPGQPPHLTKDQIKTNLDLVFHYRLSNNNNSRETYLKVVSLCKEIIASDSMNVDAYLGIGDLFVAYYVPEITIDTLIKYINKAIAIDSLNSHAYELRGYKYQEKKLPQAAINDYLKAIDLWPDYEKTDLVNCLADCYFELENYNEAKKWYTVLIEKNDYQDPDVPARVGYEYRAYCKYLLGDKKGACEDLKKSRLDVTCSEFEKSMEKVYTKQK